MGRMKDWAKCLDCGERRIVYHKEWIRAARPRCLRCGGPIEPSKAAAKEHTVHYDGKKDIEVLRDRKMGR